MGAWVGGVGGAGGVDASVGVGIRVVGESTSLIGDEVYGTAADVLAGGDIRVESVHTVARTTGVDRGWSPAALTVGDRDPSVTCSPFRGGPPFVRRTRHAASR